MTHADCHGFLKINMLRKKKKVLSQRERNGFLEKLMYLEAS
jgi:hypothetical protein